MRLGVVSALVYSLAPAIAAASNDGDGSTAESIFSASQAAARAGNYDAAIWGYGQLAIAYPHNVDYAFGYAQVLYWSGDPDASMEYLGYARRLAPGYEDIWKFEYQVRAAQTGPEARMALERFRKEASLQFPGAVWLAQGEPRSPGTYRWSISARRDLLDNGYSDWQSQHASIERRWSTGVRSSAAVTSARRFGAADTEFQSTIASALGQYWFAGAAASLSASPQFLPQNAIEINAGRNLGSGWLAALRWNRRNYARQHVDMAGLNIERYFDRYRVAYSITSASVEGDQATVHAIAFDAYRPSGGQLGVVAALGEEIDSVAAGELTKCEIWSVTLNGRIPINGYLSLGWQLGTHRQGDYYRRSLFEVSILGGY